MVRRRRSKAKAGSDKARPLNKKDASIKKWEKYSDIPLDDEDQFHENRDHILLDGNASYDNGDSDGDDDEVFSLKGMPLSTSSDEDEAEDSGLDDDAAQEELVSPKKPKKKRKKAKSSADAEEQSSSEEEEHWGSKKSAYYSSNAAEIDSEDEEANELELQEARRIQRKMLEDLCDEDFGITNLAARMDLNDTDDDLQQSSSSNIPSDKPTILRHLEKTNPISLALARDWDETARSVLVAKAQIDNTPTTMLDTLTQGMLHTYYQTLLTYASTLAFYFYLRSIDKYARRPELLDSHPILSRLLTLKQCLVTLEQLGSESSDDGEELGEFESDGLALQDDADSLWRLDSAKGLEVNELEELLAEANTAGGEVDHSDHAPVVEEHSPPKKKRKAGKSQSEAEAIPVFDVEEPDFSVLAQASSKTPPHRPSTIDAYGELTSLDHADALDKASKKKSLRFHTSRLDGMAARRQAARAAMGGDDDVPYRERRKEREIREARELEKQKSKLGQGGADLDDVDPEPRNDSPDDDYYEQVRREAEASKASKQAKYDEASKAARELDYEMGDDSAGQRALTRAILTNKGLTPRRPKSVRNPRVKKRQKFEKAKQKVSSQKAVYKGGLSQTGGRYEGEKTGISKVAKGIKLS